MQTTVFVIIFIIILIILTFIRARTASKYEVKLSDVIVGLVPVVLWLLLSGQVQELGIGDLKVKLQEAYKKPVESQVRLKDASLVEEKEFLLIGVDCTYAHEDEIKDTNNFPNYRPFRFIVIG